MKKSRSDYNKERRKKMTPEQKATESAKKHDYYEENKNGENGILAKQRKRYAENPDYWREYNKNRDTAGYMRDLRRRKKEEKEKNEKDKNLS